MVMKEIQHRELRRWIEEMVMVLDPKEVYLCDGSEQEHRKICDLLESKGVFVALNSQKRPNSYWCRSNADDVARVEERTFICSKSKADAGPTNNWCDPEEMRKRLLKLFQGAMRGRVLYIIPFQMGPYNAFLNMIGVQLTDSPYVVANTYLMTRMGKKALKALGTEGSFVRCLHSVGHPLPPGEDDVFWPCNKEKYIAHFPESMAVWSYGSGYGGNALLGKKCLALRIASVRGRNEGWLAEHMLIVGVTNPEGKKRYFAAAFPSACGKTNLAMLLPSLPGWKVECVGDDIAWMQFKEDGQLYAVNPERGFFGVAPGTSFASNPNAMESIRKDTIFTNVALTDDKDVWWEGMTLEKPFHLTDWKGNDWSASAKTPAAHPNARFTAAITNSPCFDPSFDSEEGVPISAILWGGRRASLQPLVYEAFHWNHGVFLGASLTSETTAAAKGEVGRLRRDPFAMLPFCGYNMGAYFQHWIDVGQGRKPPAIYHVNWFLKDNNGQYLWPGFGDNIRVLKWIFDRTEGKVEAQKTAIGYLPLKEDLDVSNLTLTKETIEQLLRVDTKAFMKELEGLEEYFLKFSLPKALQEEIDAFRLRLRS